MIVRHMDDLGRIVVPAEFRKELNLETGDKVGMILTGREIRLVPVKTSCRYCGRTAMVIVGADGAICRGHLDDFNEEATHAR